MLRRLVAAAATARCPQFRIGAYRIDFVLNAPDGRRLAIECDGDGYHGPERGASDMRRQAILERVGNCVFVRMRGSVFARDPDAAMRPVWQRAEELGLHPAPHDPRRLTRLPGVGRAGRGRHATGTRSSPPGRVGGLEPRATAEPKSRRRNRAVRPRRRAAARDPAVEIVGDRG